MSTKTKMDYERDGVKSFARGEPEPAKGTTWQSKYFYEGYMNAQAAINKPGAPSGAVLGHYAHGIRNRMQGPKWSAWPPAARGHSMQILKDLELEPNVARARRLQQRLLVIMYQHGQAVAKQIAAQTNTEAAP